MTLLKEKPVVTAAVMRAFEHVATLRRGDTIAWETLEGIAGFERYTQHWSAFIVRLRRMSLSSDRGIRLAAITNVGLKLLTEQEQVRSDDRARRARRQLNRGIKELRAVPDAGLGDHDRNLKYRKIEAAATARLQASRALRVERLLSKPRGPDIPRTR